MRHIPDHIRTTMVCENQNLLRQTRPHWFAFAAKNLTQSALRINRKDFDSFLVLPGIVPRLQCRFFSRRRGGSFLSACKMLCSSTQLMISSDLAMLVWQPKQQQEEDEEEDEEEKQQHRQEQRPFACTFDGCEKTYKRGDHLNRHMLTHGGKRFLCPYKGCGQAFTMNSNLQRHLRGHEQRFPTTTRRSSQVFGGGFPAAVHVSENERVECLEPGCGRLFLSPWGLRGHEFHAHGKRLACPEPGCGKAFRFRSCLQTHEEHVHGKMSAEDMTTICLEPGCGETFQGVTELRLHKKASHSSVVCDICGMSMMRTSLKQHLVTHEDETCLFPCSFPGCLHSYTTKSNLNQHVSAVHNELKPYICSHVDCGRQFAYRAVRDRHEMSGLHFPSQGDFELEDANFRGMQRGGRKRLFLHSVEDLLRQKKRHS